MPQKDMVMFLMPNGTEVSNDPRFDLSKALTEALNDQPNRGDAGITHEEQLAQTQVEHVASINSTQPGVGPNATVDDPTRDAYGPLGSPAQQRQVEDRYNAEMQGASPKSTSVDDPEPVDSNEEVQKVRKQMAERYAKAQQALATEGQEEGDRSQPYSEWTGKQLKAEVARRNTDGRDEDSFLKISKGMKVADVAAMLEEDDRRVDSTSGPTGDPVTQEDLEEADADDEGDEGDED